MVLSKAIWLKIPSGIDKLIALIIVSISESIFANVPVFVLIRSESIFCHVQYSFDTPILKNLRNKFRISELGAVLQNFQSSRHSVRLINHSNMQHCTHHRAEVIYIFTTEINQLVQRYSGTASEPS